LSQIEDLREIPEDAAAAAGAADDINIQSPKLSVDISTSFPQSEVFGVKLVNNRATQAILDVSNNEVEPITVAIIGGSLLTPLGAPGAPETPQVIRNLTAAKIGLQIPAGGKESVPFSFVQELHPQDLTLNLVALLQNSEGAVFTKQVYSEKVSVVEAPVSFFDPQMYVQCSAQIHG